MSDKITEPITMNYRVKWEIDIEADSPEEAACKALIIQRDNDPANSATVFDVSWAQRTKVRKKKGLGFYTKIRESYETKRIDLSKEVSHASM